MRILAVHPGPNFSVADVHEGWVDAFKELGLGVADCNLDRRLETYSTHPKISAEEAVMLANHSLRADCFDWWPDVLFITSCMYLTRQTLEIIRSRGIRVVILHTESPYEDDIQIQRAAVADVNLLNDPTNLDSFRQQAGPSWYAPQAYRPDRHYPRDRAATPVEHRSDFVFVGTAFPSRVEFMERVDWTGIDAALGGHWANLDVGSPLAKLVAHPLDECLPNEQTAELYAGTKVSANWYRKEAHLPGLANGWAMSPREVELAAMQRMFLREPRGEGDHILPMLPTFSDPEDFGEQVRWWMAHDDERAEVAEMAAEAVSERTFLNHAKCLMRILGV